MITHEQLLALYSYDEATGLFTRLKKIGAGAPGVLKTRPRQGYLRLCIDFKLYLQHRLAWFYVHGEWPAGMIDHINGNKADNRMANLRLADQKINQQNRKRANKQTRSKLLGAYRKKGGKHFSHIRVGDRQIFLGMFDTAELAHEAFVAAKRTYHSGNTI